MGIETKNTFIKNYTKKNNNKLPISTKTDFLKAKKGIDSYLPNGKGYTNIKSNNISNNNQESVLGTTGYLTTKAGSGIVGAFEGIADIGAGALKGIGKVSSWLANNKVGEFIFGEGAGDYKNNPFYQIGNSMVEDDVAGTISEIADKELEDKSYAKRDNLATQISQGVGQVAGIALTGKYFGPITKIPSINSTTKAGKTFNTIAKLLNQPTSQAMFLSTSGNSYTKALNEGATEKEAIAYGLLNGVKETGSELLYGGLGSAFGVGALDEVAELAISNLFKSKIGKAFTKYGVSIFGEGVEEIISEMFEPLLQRIYKSKEDITPNTLDNFVNSFVIGAITSGIFNIPNIATDISQVGKNINSNIDTSPANFNQALVNNEVNENIIKDEDKSVLNTQPILETNKPQDIQKQIIENTVSLENLQKLRENTLTTIEQKNIDKQINELQTKISALETHLEQNNTVDIKPLEIPKIDTEIDSNIELNQELENSSFSLKQKQNDIIQNSNPAEDDLHTWIRNVDDIKTFEETLNDDSYKEYYDAGEDFDPSYTADMAKEALNTGKITVYSSYPIKDGIFVSPSKMEAESYSGSGKVYSKLVNLTDVAWIDPTQGQYAKTNSEIKFSKGNIPINNKLLNKYDSVNEIFAKEKTNYDKKIKVDNNLDDIKNKTATEIYHYAIEIFNKNHNIDVFFNDGNKILVTNTDIKESVNKILNDKLQKKYLREHLIVFSDLGDIIEQSSLVNQTKENKGREKYNIWNYYYTGLNIENDLYNLEFDVVSRKDGQNHYRLQRIEKANTRSVLSKNGETDLRAFALTTDNIPQSNENVKPNILSTKYSMQKNEKNTKYSVSETTNKTWDTFLESNYKSTGTKTNMQAIKESNENNKKVGLLPKAKPIETKKRSLTSDNNNINMKKNNSGLKVTQKNNKKINNNNQTNDSEVKIRSWSETVTESDGLDQKIVEEAMKGQDFTYIPDSNKKQWDYATNKVEKIGYEKAINEFNSIINSGKSFSANDLALGQKLLQEASNKKDIQTFKELLPKITIIGTELGQAVQSLSIIKKLSPEGQLKYLQQTVDHMKKKNVKGADKIEITDKMVETILNSKGTEELTNNIDIVKEQISQQLPSTLKEKIVAWRYLSMLGNPRTHIRNIVSNTAMKGTQGIKNTIAKAIETIVNPIIKKSGQERTKTFEKSSKVVKDFVKDYSQKVVGDLNNTSKYSMELEIKKAKKIFGDKGFGGFLQKLYDLNSKGLEFEDTLFKNSAYKSAMEQYLTANGIKTQQDINNNRNLVNNASLYAMEESLKSTFQQYSAFASSLNQLKHKNTTVEFALDALMPFTKTPANILKTGASYSPLGLLKTIGYDTIQLKKGKISITTYIDNISQGLTGSGIVMLGYMLAQSGLIKAGGDDDKEDKYNQALGNQTYSIQIGNQNFTLDWLSPVAMPLFIGAELSNMKENGAEDTFNINTMTNMLTTTFDPMMQMSLLQGVNNALSGYKDNKLQAVVEESTKSYISQLFPTIGGQIAKTIDPTIRSTSTSKDSGWTLGEQILRSNIAKIPGLTYFLEPSTDVWGNEKQRSENIIVRAFENFIAPYSRKENIESGIDEELKRLYVSTGEDELIPTISLSKTITYKGEKYQTNSKEYTQFKETYGRTAFETLDKLFKTETYKNSTESEKINLIKNTYTYAKDKAKQEFLNSQNVVYYNTTKNNKDIYRDNYITKVIENDISYDSVKSIEQSPIKYSVITSFNVDYNNYTKYQKEINDIKDTYSGTDNSTIRKQKVWNYINDLKLSKVQKVMLYKTCGNYSISDYRNQMFQYINNLKISKTEKEEMWKWLYS